MSEEALVREGGGENEARQLTEVQEMRALTHPVRLALLEVLSIEGALTATEAGERIGESATTCSFHLRQLAKYGFVEEAGGGQGRRRPWRLVRRSISFSGTGDDEHTVAANELSNLLVQRFLRRHERWKAVQHVEPEWAEVTGLTEQTLFLTAEETAAVQGAIKEVLDRYKDRMTDPTARPAGARPVEAVLFVQPYIEQANSAD